MPLGITYVYTTNIRFQGREKISFFRVSCIKSENNVYTSVAPKRRTDSMVPNRLMLSKFCFGVIQGHIMYITVSKHDNNLYVTFSDFA